MEDLKPPIGCFTIQSFSSCIIQLCDPSLPLTLLLWFSKLRYKTCVRCRSNERKVERTKPAAHTAHNSCKNRQRNVIWFNPPFSMNVQTNIGREFLNLVIKLFPKNHRYSKIFNKNNITVSYSCTDELQTIIKKHKRKILETSKTPPTENNCNCRKKKTTVL